MGFLQDIKNRVLIRDPEERKYFESQLEKERAAARDLQKLERKKELDSMAKFQAMPRPQRVKARVENAKEGVDKAAKVFRSAAEKFQAIDEKGRKLTNGGGALGRAFSQDKENARSGGLLGEAMEGRSEKKERMRKGKTVTIRFD
jgi:hypothetical protein